MKKPYVFISYSTKESDSANLVHSYLEGNGINCWIASHNIEGGESFAVQIVDAIGDCSAFILMASENSNNSPHVSNELSLALSARKKIIPFRLNDFIPSKSSQYFLQQAQWIDAYLDMNEGLKNLLKAVRVEIPIEKTVSLTPVVPEIFVKQKEGDGMGEVEDDCPDFTREEIVNILLGKISKFPYCLRDRTYGDAYDSFKAKARVLFDNTVTLHYKGRITAGGVDYVDIIADTLSQGQGISIQVKGLPGCAKNMLLQLAYYKMLERFRTGQSDYLPLYLSSAYYEKQPYSKDNARAEMHALIKEECKEYFSFLKKNSEVHPVLMVEAIREHIISDFFPEDVILELWQPLGKFNRVTAVDIGLIKNRLNHKKTIPLIGDVSGYTFKFHSIPITDKKTALKVIRVILDMYIEQYDGLEPIDVYNAMYRLHFTIIDIFTVRLVATELSQGYSVEDISLIDMYERLALNELKGDEAAMLNISGVLYQYVFDEYQNVKNRKYDGRLWSLPHKHNTYLEFMIAYYFSHCILHGDGSYDFSFLKISMTSMANRFTASHLKNNYPMQEKILNLVTENYQSFDYCQKSNAMYWLGKLTYAELTDSAQAILEGEFSRLKQIVKNDNRQTLENRRNQYLFRSVCYGLISYKKTSVLDDYLCLIVINDVAAAIDRGAVIQYMGENQQVSRHNDFYVDSNPNLGEQAIRILCSNVEARLMAKRTGYVETYLVSLLSLIQARMHTTPEKLAFNLTPYCKKCLELLSEYQKRPRSIVSDKLLYYFKSVEEDLRHYIEYARFDAAYSLYTGLSKMKDTKRNQWLEYGIDDPESVAEHTLNAWMLALIFLPIESSEQNYNKQEVLDMLLVHDMAEAFLGDTKSQLSEPTKELKEQNEVLRKMFLKGTYPEVANMTHYYNVWVGYFNAQNINARIARDVNLIQTVNTFFTYFISTPEKFNLETVKSWLNEGNKLSTDIGYDLFERIIIRNPIYRKATDKLITGSSREE